MLGNLARPSCKFNALALTIISEISEFVADTIAFDSDLKSTEGIWPWSYSTCGDSSESLDARVVQEIDACTYGRGRGSPEIDIIESQPGNLLFYYNGVEYTDGTLKDAVIGRPMISSSLQVSPGISKDIRPEAPNFPLDGQWYPSLYPMGSQAYANHTPNATTMVPRMINNYWCVIYVVVAAVVVFVVISVCVINLIFAIPL